MTRKITAHLLGLFATVFCLVAGVAGCRHGRVNSVEVEPLPFRAIYNGKTIGNTYYIRADYATNGIDPDDLAGITATLFPKRVNIMLSLDDGLTWPVRIAHGLPFDANPTNGYNVQYEYSLPWWDPAYYTGNARIKVTKMDGTTLIEPSYRFQIVGLTGLRPAHGNAVLVDTLRDLWWYSVGTGPEVEVGYITPTNVTWDPFMTVSNCVDGTNQFLWHCTQIPAGVPQMKLVFRSVSDPLLIGYSGVFSTL